MADNKILQLILDGQKAIRDDIKKVDEKVEENGKWIDRLGVDLAALSVKYPFFCNNCLHITG